ncbi:MAG: hypothetical protein ABJJ03_18155, partial [Sulfitobacter sp.]
MTRQILANVALPPALTTLPPSEGGWCRADVVIEGGTIAAVIPTGTPPPETATVFDAKGAILTSALVDCHTHLDKAHVAAFHDFPAGDLMSAIHAMAAYKQSWTADSLRARVEFSLRSAYAYGVRAMRSHVDFSLLNAPFVWQVMTDIQTAWQGRIEVQLSPLAAVEEFSNPEFVTAISAAAQTQGCLGVFIHGQSDMETLLQPVFDLAAAQNWDLDFHVDEGTDPALNGLAAVAN